MRMSSNPARVSGRGSPAVALVFFLLGAALTFAGFEYAGNSRGGAGLSAGARGLLQQLSAPVQVRFYSVLPAESAGPPLQDFSARVDHLLSDVQNANSSQIQVLRIVSAAETNADAAAAEGLRAFNLEKGGACFLGIVVASGDRKESLPELQPEWETALADDVARAILRVDAPPPPVSAPVVKAAPAITPALTREILQLIPNPAATSPEDADRIFHQDFLKQCARAGAEMESQINIAAQAVVKAQNSGSASDLEAAKKNLAKVQFDQTEKLKDVAAHLQLQLDVFAQMKAAATNTAK